MQFLKPLDPLPNLKRKPLSMCKTKNRIDTSVIKFLFQKSQSQTECMVILKVLYIFFFFLINVCEAGILTWKNQQNKNCLKKNSQPGII